MNERTNACNYVILYEGQRMKVLMALIGKDSSKPSLESNGENNYM